MVTSPQRSGKPLPAERRARILEALRSGRVVAVRALCQELGVSPMTVHRDLEALVREGQAVRVRGGAMGATPEPGHPWPQPAGPGAGPAPHGGPEVSRASGAGYARRCAACGKAVHERTAFTVELAGGERRAGCCPHCGVLLVDGGARLAMATDFLHGNVVNARAAHYLVGPAVTVCCSPTVLAFERQDDAVRFQHGFGGEILDLAGALRRVRAEMALPHAGEGEGA